MSKQNLEKLNRAIGFIEGIAMGLDCGSPIYAALWSHAEDLNKIYEEEMKVEILRS